MFFDSDNQSLQRIFGHAALSIGVFPSKNKQSSHKRPCRYRAAMKVRRLAPADTYAELCGLHHPASNVNVRMDI